MPGRYGGRQVTVKNLEVVEVDEANGYLYIRGAVPGWRNNLVAITSSGELSFKLIKLSRRRRDQTGQSPALR